MTVGKEVILIIGGGLGGVAAALGLARQGFRVRVFEQSGVLSEAGAGLTVPASAIRSLHMLGVGEAVRLASDRAVRMPLLHYQTGALMGGAPDEGEEFYDPNDWTTRHMLRTDLHSILVKALLDLDPDSFVLGHRFTSAESFDDSVSAHFVNGAVARGDILIGCDGLRSAVRSFLFKQVKPSFTGQVTWRCLLPMEFAAPFMSAGRSAIFIGPGRLFNRYAVRGKSVVNCVASAKTNIWSEEGWSVPSTIEEFRAEYKDWHPDVVGLIELAPPAGLFKWALFEREPLTSWTSGRIALLGDAAHPMLPFLGLGAALAIEDAVVLSKALGESTGDPAMALKRYEQARIERATMLFHAARRQGEVLQGTDPNDYMGSNPPAANRALFDYDPSEALR